jgi:hypothetical protein
MPLRKIMTWDVGECFVCGCRKDEGSNEKYVCFSCLADVIWENNTTPYRINGAISRAILNCDYSETEKCSICERHAFTYKIVICDRHSDSVKY